MFLYSVNKCVYLRNLGDFLKMYPIAIGIWETYHKFGFFMLKSLQIVVYV